MIAGRVGVNMCNIAYVIHMLALCYKATCVTSAQRALAYFGHLFT